MTKAVAVAVVLFVACKSDEDYKKQQPPPEPEKEEVVEKKPPPPPPKKALTPEELGKCTLTASGGVTAEQTTLGGRPATNVSYWMTESERKNMMGVDGFAVNCHGSDIRFSILPGGGNKDGMPFAPKKYTFKAGAKGDASLSVTFGAKTMDKINGTVDITEFDKSHIAGTVNLTGTLVPKGGSVKLTGEFNFKCPGFSGCE